MDQYYEMRFSGKPLLTFFDGDQKACALFLRKALKEMDRSDCTLREAIEARLVLDGKLCSLNPTEKKLIEPFSSWCQRMGFNCSKMYNRVRQIDLHTPFMTEEEKRMVAAYHYSEWSEKHLPSRKNNSCTYRGVMLSEVCKNLHLGVTNVSSHWKLIQSRYPDLPREQCVEIAVNYLLGIRADSLLNTEKLEQFFLSLDGIPISIYCHGDVSLEQSVRRAVFDHKRKDPRETCKEACMQVLSNFGINQKVFSLEDYEVEHPGVLAFLVNYYQKKYDVDFTIPVSTLRQCKISEPIDSFVDNVTQCISANEIIGRDPRRFGITYEPQDEASLQKVKRVS